MVCMSFWFLFKFKYYIFVVPAFKCEMYECAVFGQRTLRISFSFIFFLLYSVFNNPWVFVYWFFCCCCLLLFRMQLQIDAMLKQDDEMFSVLLSPKNHLVLLVGWFFFVFLFRRTFIFIVRFSFGMIGWKRSRLCAQKNLWSSISNKAWHAPVRIRMNRI